jgi:hypothetical protein
MHACNLRYQSNVGLLSLILLGDGTKLRRPAQYDFLYSPTYQFLILKYHVIPRYFTQPFKVQWLLHAHLI